MKSKSLVRTAGRAGKKIGLDPGGGNLGAGLHSHFNVHMELLALLKPDSDSVGLECSLKSCISNKPADAAGTADPSTMLTWSPGMVLSVGFRLVFVAGKWLCYALFILGR